MTLQIGPVQVLYTKINSPENSPKYCGLNPSSTILEKGYSRSSEHASFLVESIHERDFAIPLRDGVKLRADIFRPVSDQKIPALIAWSPYGKTCQSGLSLDIMPGRVGVHQSRNSGFESFEAPDPAEWTARGYAICNVDTRGAFDSEGDMRWWGSGEGRDGYDAVEYIAQLPWCNGKVALVGNSWLAIAQYFIAAEQPPHLACIAPLEGASDIYRDNLCRGGVPNPAFGKFVASTMFGRSQQEDVGAMIMTYPAWNEYWEDKRAKLDAIRVPSYILASYSSGLHTAGSFRAFEEISGSKWLRVHPYQEWYDLYAKDTNNELQKFFDRYTKGIDNGWETTPQVRISILAYDKPPIINKVFPNYPIPDTDYQTFYLAASGEMCIEKPEQSRDLGYQADEPYQQRDEDREELRFERRLDGPCYLIGGSTATLFMSTANHDDIDVTVQIRKADKFGKLLRNFNIPLEDLGMTAEEVPKTNVFQYLGPTGVIRASHREKDPELSKEYQIVLSHQNPQKLRPGEVVKLEIPIWPTGIAFEAGERLVIKISGHDMRFPEFDVLAGKMSTGKGRNTVYCGKDGYYSSITVPFVKV